MNITEQELQNLPLLNLSSDTHNNGGNIYKVSERVIYKIFKDLYSFQEEVERNIDFQITNAIPNTPKIYNKLFLNGKFSGYSMEYIPNAVTFRKAIGEDFDLSTKFAAIKIIYEALKYLHQHYPHHIFLGDIHADNFLITREGAGYIIDLDYMRFPNDEYKFQQCYLIKPNNNSCKINVASEYTDNIKVMISCLSLLLNTDLEEFISSKTSALNLEELYDKVILPLNNPSLSNYFERLQNKEKVEYFDDWLSFQNLSKHTKTR